MLTHKRKGQGSLVERPLVITSCSKRWKVTRSNTGRNWQLIAGEFQHYGGDSIANKLRGHGKQYRAILLDVAKRLKLKADKSMSTFEIEQQLLEHFLRHTWQEDGRGA
ncbi:positive regulator for sigma H [Salmonella enterica subsp. enterica]|uniref:Positive regulator for sigma H n=1 Tax=Salmonella enterica I TaxID=59201 RepID=A0A3S5DM26_SALET|nr:positive regulator for sigma H [Salmonella enterica subsp. enterica]